MERRNYKFVQGSRYSAPWNGEIALPESAVFYKLTEYCKTQQMWYAVIPMDDFNEETYDVEGCCQVRTYELDDKVLVYFHDIAPEGEWPDVGEEKFNELFKEFFESLYIYEWRPAKYELEDVPVIKETEIYMPNFKKVEDEVLVAACHVHGLEIDGQLNVTAVGLRTWLQDYKSDLTIIKSEFQISQLQNVYHPRKHKFVLSKDGSRYNAEFDNVCAAIR